MRDASSTNASKPGFGFWNSLLRHLILFAHLALVIYATCFGDWIAINLVVFSAILSAAFGTLLIFCPVGDAKEAVKTPIPYWLRKLVDIAEVVLLAGAGWFWCAGAFALSAIAVVAKREEVRKALEKEAA